MAHTSQIDTCVYTLDECCTVVNALPVAFYKLADAVASYFNKSCGSTNLSSWISAEAGTTTAATAVAAEAHFLCMSAAYGALKRSGLVNNSVS